MLPSFDRFDICEAYAVLEWDYNVNGWLRERPTNRRRMQATSVQLFRLGFKAHPDLCYETLSENGQAIYDQLVERYCLPKYSEPVEAGSTDSRQERKDKYERRSLFEDEDAGPAVG